MFCPQGKAEYRPGFTRCSDCDVELVDQLPAESDQSPIPSPSEAQSKRVWFCDEQTSCMYVCAALRAAEIPFRVNQQKHQFFWNVDEHYEVFVPANFYEKAKTIAEQSDLDFSDTDEDQKIMELPDAGGPAVVKDESRNRRWRAEDATVEIWSEKTEDRAWFEQVKGLAWMIELSLRENGIGRYIDVSQDGVQKIFVRPEDEVQAREIAHEIKDGAPK